MNPRIGIDLGGTKTLGVVLEADDSISARVRLPTPRGSYADTVSVIVDMVKSLDGSGALMVGVGAPGAWIESRGSMQNCNSTWLNGQPLLTDLEQVLGRRVRLANDADCFALSEALSGSGAGCRVVFGAILGTGVGGGLVIDSQLLTGPNGLAGEWGHTPIPYLDEEPFPSRRCYCGRTNCIETFLSGPGLLATHQVLWPGESDPPHDAAAVYHRASLETGPAGWAVLEPTDGGRVVRARSTLGVYCRMLARSLAQIVNLTDPHAIVLGGGLSQMSAIYQPVHELMSGHVFGDVFETVLLAPRWGDASGVRGAAWLWQG